MTSAYRNYPSYYEAQSKSLAYGEAQRDIRRYSGMPARAEEKSARNVMTYEEEFVESDDEPLDVEQERYYDEVAAGRCHLRGDDPYWEMKSNLNGPLRKLFAHQSRQQFDSKYEEDTWQCPSTYGLENSAPIIATQHNVSRGRSVVVSAESKGTYADDHHNLPSKATAPAPQQPSQTNTLYNMIQSGRVNYATAQLRDRSIKKPQQPQQPQQQPRVLRPATPPQHQAWSDPSQRPRVAHSSGTTSSSSTSSQQYSRPPSKEEEDEDEDEDEDEESEEYDLGEDEEDDEEDEDVLRNLAGSTGLSANLKALLGLSDTDAANSASEDQLQQMPAWAPPARSGLDNSAPLVSKNNNYHTNSCHNRLC